MSTGEKSLVDTVTVVEDRSRKGSKQITGVGELWVLQVAGIIRTTDDS
jgi:hypothetical protein